MVLAVNFDYTHMAAYYIDFINTFGGDRKALSHHLGCLGGPVSDADFYLNVARDIASPAEKILYLSLFVSLRKAVSGAKAKTNRLFGRYPLPPDEQLCKAYGDQMVLFGNAMPEDFKLEGAPEVAKKFLSAYEDGVHMPNAMFSPIEPDPEILKRLEKYHRGEYPQMFSLNRHRLEVPKL